MGQKLQIDKENKAVLLFNKGRQKWEDKTLSISAMFSAFYYGKFTGYNVYFNGSGKKFFYRNQNVQFLDKVNNINIEKQDVYVDGNIVIARKVDAFEGGYYRVYVEKGVIFTQNIEIKSNKHKHILLYYSMLADYAGMIAKEKGPLYFLSQNYKRMTPSSDSVLFDYLRGECKPISDTGAILVPFDFNQSQFRAIKTALKNKISVIEGPPGTGKTQTILNLIANIIYQQKNCAVISNNNTAIENVYEKLSDEKLSFMAAPLGRKTNVEKFFESDRNGELTSFLEQKEEPVKSKDLARVSKLLAQMKKIQDVEVETSVLESQLTDLRNEQRHCGYFSEDSLIINQRLSSKDYMKFIIRLEKPRKLWFFERWILGIRFKVKIALHDVNILLNNAEQLYYRTKMNELTKTINANKKFLEKHSKEQVGKELKSLCRLLFDKFIRSRYQNQASKEFDKESYKRDFDNFLQRYPVVLSTSHSLLNNAPQDFKFDYLIIDEASQGDLLSSVLAMNCAKNLVVVGDSRQLQQIDEEMLFPQSEKLSRKYDVPKPYRYESNSILKSVKDAVSDVPTSLLREHYRCAPDIINFCNKMFYDGELVAMTRNTGQHIKIIKTVPGNHARRNPHGSGLYNQREIDEIENVLKESKSDSIGIISPFRHQANLITGKYATHRIEADKVYRSSNNAVNDFIKYAEYLYGSDVTRESTVTSVFDLLYSEYTNILLSRCKKRPNKHKTELLMCDAINHVLKHLGYIGYSMHTRLGKLVKVPDTFSDEERRYILHPWTHVDFLFYHKVSKEKLFVIEVDGIRHHEQDRKQAEHDDIKNRILRTNNIPIYRFKTNESNEKQRLTEIINGYSH